MEDYWQLIEKLHIEPEPCVTPEDVHEVRAVKNVPHSRKVSAGVWTLIDTRKSSCRTYSDNRMMSRKTRNPEFLLKTQTDFVVNIRRFGT